MLNQRFSQRKAAGTRREVIQKRPLAAVDPASDNESVQKQEKRQRNADQHEVEQKKIREDRLAAHRMKRELRLKEVTATSPVTPAPTKLSTPAVAVTLKSHATRSRSSATPKTAPTSDHLRSGLVTPPTPSSSTTNQPASTSLTPPTVRKISNARQAPTPSPSPSNRKEKQPGTLHNYFESTKGAPQANDTRPNTSGSKRQREETLEREENFEHMENLELSPVLSLEKSQALRLEAAHEDERPMHPLVRTVPKSRPSMVDEAANVVVVAKLPTTVVTRRGAAVPPLPLSSVPSRLPLVNILSLPASFDTLDRLFRGLDHLVTFQTNQGRPTMYHKIQKQVERVSGKNFELGHLGQIMTIFPEAFEFSVAPCLNDLGQQIRSIRIENKKVILPADKDGVVKIPDEVLRRQIFHERLVKRVHDAHVVFLNSTIPPRTDEYPVRWHPEFNLMNVPAVEEAKEMPTLTKPVVKDGSLFDTAGLGTGRGIKKSEAVPVHVPVELTSATSSSEQQLPQPATASPVPLTRLELIKEKMRQAQAARRAASQGMATAQEKLQSLMKSRLPKIFDMIRFLNKRVMALIWLSQKVAYSYPQPMSDKEAEDHLVLMTEVLPEWCDIAVLCNARHFRVQVGDHVPVKEYRSKLVALTA